MHRSDRIRVVRRSLADGAGDGQGSGLGHRSGGAIPNALRVAGALVGQAVVAKREGELAACPVLDQRPLASEHDWAWRHNERRSTGARRSGVARASDRLRCGLTAFELLGETAPRWNESDTLRAALGPDNAHADLSDPGTDAAGSRTVAGSCSGATPSCSEPAVPLSIGTVLSFASATLGLTVPLGAPTPPVLPLQVATSASKATPMPVRPTSRR